MKKSLAIIGIMVAVVMSASIVMALPFNIRPITSPPALLFNGGGGEQKLGGTGGIFEMIGASTYAADPVNTQSPAAIFANDASGGSVASFIIAIAGNYGTNVGGIYKSGNTSSLVPVFSGATGTGVQATISFFANGTVKVTDTGIGGGVVPGTYPNFGNAFGFYLTGAGGTFYSEDDKNAGGNPQALIYQGNGIDTVTIPGFAPGIFTKDEFIIAWEDLPWASTDKDFNDLVFAVESITPIPEPATMLLLGSGLIGLAGVARRRFRKN